MTTPLRSICVFCGSERGDLAIYAAAARALGSLLARSGVVVVYGGGNVGLMKELADAVLAEAGQVVGVIPSPLVDRELAHGKLSELRVVASMHERKALMADLSDAFIALPGGLGTLDETVEIITWRQLRLHDKPILLCDVIGSSAPLVAAIESAIALGFARPEVRHLFEVHEGVAAVLERLASLPAGPGAPPGRL
jgi:uncharacterized protein (TIGR00730 family)